MTPRHAPWGRSTRTLCAALLACLAAAAPAHGVEQDLSGSFAVQGRLYPEPPVHGGQDRHDASVSGELEYVLEWDSGDRITLKPFFRYDFMDGERSHADLREAAWLTFGKGWELRLGIDKVFWGVTESVHLVDIVNQTDLIESIDFEDKLGQPMIYLSLPGEWGVVDLFVLPYFRPRTFPGRDGRLRLEPPVDAGRPRFESGLKRFHPDLAARYSHAVGPFDFGLAYFRGTGREPSFLLGVDDSLAPILLPFYPQIDQASFDGQVTLGPWLLKMEALYRWGQPDLAFRENGYFASVAGFEYTLFDVFGTGADIGLLMEHLYDDRGRLALTPFENDLFAGLRLAFNDVDDTALLAGVIQDLGGPARNFFLEASRRLAEGWTLAIEARFFTETPRDDFIFPFRRDDFVQIDLTFHF